MRKDTLYLTLSRDITSYTITSGQRAIATNVNYAVTIESPTLTTNLAGRDVSLIISDTDGNTLTTATTFYPDTKNPYKAVTGSLLLDGGVYGKFFDGKPVDTAVRLPIVIRDKSATLLSSDIVVANGGEVAEPSASDEIVAGLVNAIRFYDLAEFKAWLDGTKERPDGIKPTDIVVGQWVHTQQDGSFICKELIGAEPSVTKNFTTIVTQFPLTGTLKMNPDNGIGLSVYSGDVYNDADATSFSVDAITYKGDSFTFTAGDNQIARQKDNYALENRVNSTMTATLNAVKADNANTYQAMLPVMNTTVEARDRAETAASNAKSSEARAAEAETRAATSEANALVYKNSASASEENAGLYRQQALTHSQKAEQEAVKATTKSSEAASSASKAAASANEALYYKNSAETFSDSAESWSHSASEYAAAADTSADLAKMSEDNAAKSEANAATSAANSASSEAKSLTYKETAVASADLSTTNKNSAADFSASASASAAAAASSATAAANSATAAAQSATDLAEAVATAESLDGRIGALEAGTGVYQYSDGSVEIYQLPTRGAKHLKALKRLDCGLESVIPIDVKFTGVNIAQRDVTLCAYGEYTILHYEPNLYNSVSRLLIFDKSFNQVLRLAGFNDQKSPSGHGYIHNGRYVRMIEAYRTNGTASVRVYELGTNALLKEVTIPRLPTDNSSHYNTSILFNTKTGHTVLVYIRYAPTWQSATSPHRNPYYTSELYQEIGERALLWGRVIVLDENLAPVLDEAGDEVVYDLTPQELDALQIRRYLSANLVRGNLYAWSTGSEVGSFPVGLLTLDENDRLVPVYESFPVVDQSGYIVFATEEVTGSDGTTTTKYVIDNDNTSGRACLSPVTTFGDTPRQIVFNCYVDDADRPKMTAAKAWRTMPMWFYDTGWGYNVTLMMDGVDRYLVMRDGRMVKSWLGSGTYKGKPPVKYGKPPEYDRSSGFTLKGEKIIPVTGGGSAFYMLSLESFADGAFNVKLKTDGNNDYGVTHPHECSSLRVSRLLAANLPTLTNAYAAPLGVSAALLAYMKDVADSSLGGAGLLLADVGNLSGTYA